MRTRMAAAVLAAVLLTPLVVCAQQDVPDVVGFYDCVGKNPDGSEYHGFAEIGKVGETFRVLWTMDDGLVLGVGIWSNGVFAVSYWGGAPAVIVYKVDGNRLVGEWTMGGAEGRTYSETLTKTDKRPPQRQEPPPASPHQRQPQPGSAI